MLSSSPRAESAAVWLSTSLRRFYPQSSAENFDELAMEMARGERGAFQVVVRTGTNPVKVRIRVNSPDGVRATVRRVGYVPLAHFNTDVPDDERDGNGFVPGPVPDPLFPESEIDAPANTTNSFWVTFDVGNDAQPGPHEIVASVAAGDSAPKIRKVRLAVHPGRVSKRTDLPVTQWFYADALCDFYRVKPFEARYWKLVRTYVQDVVDHGQNMMHVPIFTPSTDGVKRPTQLLIVKRDGDRYLFDWKYVKRWIEIAKSCGSEYYEWAHLFTQWGCKNAIRIYEGNLDNETLLWPPDTAATSPIYREFLKQLLPQLHDFVKREHIEESSYFHISDEPSGAEALANYRAARGMVRELGPWMRMMDAISELHFAQEGLIEAPVPSIEVAPQFAKAGYPAWAYFCCGPRGRYLNRLMDTPLPKIRMTGWLLFRLDARGFLHWGYNYWYKSQTRNMIDPFSEQAGDAWPGWAYGDPFVVYPGPQGPIDSLRWEVFSESLRDYALLQSAKVARDDPLLSELHDYERFPKTEDWIDRTRHELLRRLDRSQGF